MSDNNNRSAPAGGTRWVAKMEDRLVQRRRSATLGLGFPHVPSVPSPYPIVNFDDAVSSGLRADLHPLQVEGQGVADQGPDLARAPGSIADEGAVDPVPNPEPWF